MTISALKQDSGYMGDPTRGAGLGRAGTDSRATAFAAREEITGLESTLASFADPEFVPGWYDRDKESGAVTFTPNFPTPESRAQWVAGLAERLRTARRELAAAESSAADRQRFHLVRERLDSGGYDSGGTYWGHGAPLYRYESADSLNEGYLRATDRGEARREVLAIYPSATFYR